VSKSGTNSFHGSGFEYHRNSSSLDAMTNDERADPTRSRRDKFISNVFGGTFGGPIKKNKAFFFVDGQLIRQRQQFAFSPGSPVITQPGLAALAAQYPGNPAIAVLVNQSLVALQPNVRVATPAGNICFPKDFTLACSGANALLVPAAFVNWTLPVPFNQKEYGLRGDVNPTNKDSFNVKYRYQQSPETNSLTGSNGRFLLRTAATVCPLDVSISVYPSGADFATLAVPGMPGRFSTINCWPHRSLSFSAMMRARRSVTLPAENGTTRRTAWFG